MSLCLSAKTHKKAVFPTYCKTIEPIELKFTHNIHLDNGSVLVNFKKKYNLFVCLSVCPHKHKTSVFRTCSKTTEAIDLKFTHNILVDLKNVLGKFEKRFCLFICLFVLKKTTKIPFSSFLQNDWEPLIRNSHITSV